MWGVRPSTARVPLGSGPALQFYAEFVGISGVFWLPEVNLEIKHYLMTE
jgi:hypothetical protein